MIRFAYRFSRFVKELRTDKSNERKRTMVVGGGEAGAMIIKELHSSSHLNQQVCCIIDDDKETLHKLSFCKEMGASFLKDAALAIVVMADPLASDVWIEDAAIASLMIQLQAEDLGLGSCWIQVRERFTATGIPSGDFVHNVLDIPLQLQVLSIVAIGHKGMERKPFNEEHLQWEKIHINKYGGE